MTCDAANLPGKRPTGQLNQAIHCLETRFLTRNICPVRTAVMVTPAVRALQQAWFSVESVLLQAGLPRGASMNALGIQW